MEKLTPNQNISVTPTSDANPNGTEIGLGKKDGLVKTTIQKVVQVYRNEKLKLVIKQESFQWWLLLVGFTVLGVASRLHYITMPNKIVWDEAHFGKMSSWYLNRTFFFDVHPPGGKMMIALFGYLAGYNGTHNFKEPGVSYDGYDEIVYIRVGCALLGSMMVPLSFGIAWELSLSLVASSLAAFLCIFEIGTIALSKFILLDPILMFFILSTFHGFSMFARTQEQQPWSLRWWACLCYTGVSLGCAMSVKFVGVFIVCVIGLHTICQLFTMYSDVTMSLWMVAKHLLARSLTLIVLPVAIYVGIFFLHDQILCRSESSTSLYGDIGVGQFSPPFQMRLINSSLYNLTQPAEASFGSVVTLRNDYLGGGYLHSHNASYPEKYVSGNLQQITSLRGKDPNNLFRILFPADDPDMEDGYYSGEQESVMNEDWIRLHHVITNSTLACHTNRSLMATKLRLIYARPYNLTDPSELQAYEEENLIKEQEIAAFHMDLWKVKVESTERIVSIKALTTRFQLISPKLLCALTWSREKYPAKWGFGQGEVSCTKNLKDPYTFWIFEQIRNPYVANTTFENITIGFWSRFIETHQTMTWVNSRLKPEDSDMPGERESPWMWPILYRSQPWYDSEFRIVLLGNPLIFLINFFTLVGSPFMLLWEFFKKKREKVLEIEEKRERIVFAVRWLWIAFLFHYVPFFFMNRILYYHHYFPALQFSSLISAIVIADLLERVSSKFPTALRKIVLRGSLVVLIALLAVSFLLYCYVAYGHPTQGAFNRDNSTFRHIRFVDQWEI